MMVVSNHFKINFQALSIDSMQVIFVKFSISLPGPWPRRGRGQKNTRGHGPAGAGAERDTRGRPRAPEDTGIILRNEIYLKFLKWNYIMKENPPP